MTGRSRSNGWARTCRAVFGLVALLTAPFWSATAVAQSPILPIPPGPMASPNEESIDPSALSAAELEALLGGLSDEQVRTLLIRWAKAQSKAPSSGSANGLLQDARAFSDRLSARLADLAAQIPELPQVFGVFATRIEGFGGVFLALLALLLSFGAGFGARYWSRHWAVERQSQIAARYAEVRPYSSAAVIGDGLLFLLIDLSSALVFWIVAMATLYLFFGHPDLRLLVSAFVSATAAVLAARSLATVCLPRDWPIYRLLPLDDEATLRVHLMAAGLAAIWSYGFFLVQLARLYGVGPALHELLVFTVATLFTLAMVGAILVLKRDAVRRGAAAREGAAPAAVVEEGPRSIAGTIAGNWHLVAIGYTMTVWATSMSAFLTTGDYVRVGDLAWNSLALILGVTLIDLVLGRYLRAQRHLNQTLSMAIRRSARLFVGLAAAAIFLSLWGVDLGRIAEAGVLGRMLDGLIDLGVIALIGYAVWDLVRTAVDVRLAEEAPAEEAVESDGEGGLGVSRAATLLPLFRSFALVMIGLVCLFSAASSLGVNIAPLIAGAGVIGIAIGFGAQTLVRDIVSGVFFLIDDAFRRGEYIEIGDVKGTVEKISVRSFQLRHHQGAVHTIPFGEIQTLTNYSRDWVIMKLPLRLTFDTDPADVKKIVKRIGQEMMADPELGPKLQDPPKSQGVIQMEDSAMILRVKFKATPGEQFILRRELLHRIRAAFELAGIKFAHREVTVRVSGEDRGADPLEVAGGAARRILDPGEPVGST